MGDIGESAPVASGFQTVRDVAAAADFRAALARADAVGLELFEELMRRKFRLGGPDGPAAKLLPPPILRRRIEDGRSCV